MSIYFPYIDIPSRLNVVLGSFDEKTRSYHAYGEEHHVRYWYEAIIKELGAIVPIASVSMYVPVSRAAVRKRVMSGQFTVFYFHSSPSASGLFFNKKEKRETAYTFVTASECKSWAAEVREKKIRLGHITREETLSEKPDWAHIYDALPCEEDYFGEQTYDDRVGKHLEAIGAKKTHAQELQEMVERFELEGIDASPLKAMIKANK